MYATTPVIAPEFASREVTYAKNQPEYTPLPTIRRDDGIILSRWKLTDEERLAVAGGADIFFYAWTNNQPLQPIRLEVAEADRSLIETAEFMGLMAE